MFKVSIVIPNWNGSEKLKKNLPQVLKVRGVDEILVSDDGSTDNSVEVLETEFPQIKLVKRETQGGFSTNVNFGVSQATGDLVFLLNSDAVPSPDCLKFIIPHFKNENVFSVGCNTGGTWSWAKWEKGFFWHYMADKKSSQPHQTLWASGGSQVFRKKIWDELTGFDQLFDPFYEEDVDLGYRATKRGYLNIFEPQAKVEHYREPGVISQHYAKSTVAKVAQRNQLFIIWKDIHDQEMMNQHITALIKMLLTQPKYWEIFLRALIHLPRVLVKRKIEKKLAKLTDQEIFKKFQI